MLATSVYSLSDRAATAQFAGFGGIVGFPSAGCLVVIAPGQAGPQSQVRPRQ
jgi:hypothetical protein